MKKLFLVIAAFAALVSCKNAVKDADRICADKEKEIMSV